MFIHIVSFLWLSYLHPCVSSVVCEGLNGPRCCHGFHGHVWNETVHNCTSCMSGFYGENCSLPCPRLYYGFRCVSKCNCSEEECHHQYGCRRSYGDCDPGVHGQYCELPCPYPGYGKLCQETCECDEQNCNLSTGCISSSSSPGSPLATITKVYPLRSTIESLDELAVLNNSCNGGVSVSTMRNTASLENVIIGLGVIFFVFMISYIGLCIFSYIYRPKGRSEQGGKRQIHVHVTV